MLYKLSHKLASAVLLSSLIAVAGCDQPESADEPRPDDESAPEVSVEDAASDDSVDYQWMPDSDAEKFAAIEEQLQGFSRTMRETGYRYVELYWAGTDRNWEYADYQLEHIEEVIDQGLVRRPARSTSAEPFLQNDIPALQETIDGEDGEAFDAQFEEFTQACNTCHISEDHSFIEIGPPDHRLSPVAPPAGE